MGAGLRWRLARLSGCCSCSYQIQWYHARCEACASDRSFSWLSFLTLLASVVAVSFPCTEVAAAVRDTPAAWVVPLAFAFTASPTIARLLVADARRSCVWVRSSAPPART